jgi:hypothetical protein
MVVLWAFNPAIGQWVPIDIKDRLCYLLLPAQNLQAHGIECYFQLGVDYALFSKEDPREADVLLR